MKKSYLPLFSFIIILAVLLSSCSALPQGLRGLFVSATPTRTATSTPTSLPVYHPFTPTPLPAVDLSWCAFAEDCPDAVNVRAYVPEGADTNVNVLEVPFDQPLSFRAIWAAIDEETLDENVKAMRFFFLLDGQPYLNHAKITRGFLQDANDPAIIHPAVGIGYVTSGWQVGESHTVRLGFEFTRDVFDGWDTYPAGTVYENTYIIKPVALPTATPTPTITNTPIATSTKTSTPRPTAVPATPTEACEVSTTINIVNDTGGWITMYFTGPAKYTFEIASGNKTLNLCAGSYSYTAYGCGGASTNGTAGDGDEIEFWCE